MCAALRQHESFLLALCLPHPCCSIGPRGIPEPQTWAPQPLLGSRLHNHSARTGLSSSARFSPTPRGENSPWVDVTLWQQLTLFIQMRTIFSPLHFQQVRPQVPPTPNPLLCCQKQ